jgi:uncharacterized protein (TIGR00255 family)
MTGFGEARGHGPGFTAAVEIRSVNNRHLKVSVRGTEPYPSLESEIEKCLRRHVKRGSVLVHIRIVREISAGQLELDVPQLAAYLKQVRSACELAGVAGTEVYAGVLALPGLTGERVATTRPPEAEWAVVERLIEQACMALETVKNAEGATMAAEFRAYAQQLRRSVEQVERLVPRVTADYRMRLLDRIRQAAEGIDVDASHIVREVAIYADRTDVSEELVRLHAHFTAFEQILLHGGDGPGRRLEFIAQEIGREINTLGSKAGDPGISAEVVDMKATLEKIRELVQNVE